MPKLKSHKGVAKRFKRTGTGKIKHKQTGKSHLLTHKTRSRKRHLRASGLVSKADQQTVKRLLPYS
ncbi:MAG TPA: 50S ribosomal protein L35 [Nitrospiria bacterium]|jgi:large subunit ribosomal protein L35|nr:50S ribosomal protein L35 [Nitrospiria bacterium]